MSSERCASPFVWLLAFLAAINSRFAAAFGAFRFLRSRCSLMSETLSSFLQTCVVNIATASQESKRLDASMQIADSCAKMRESIAEHTAGFERLAAAVASQSAAVASEAAFARVMQQESASLSRARATIRHTKSLLLRCFVRRPTPK